MYEIWVHHPSYFVGISKVIWGEKSWTFLTISSVIDHRSAEETEMLIYTYPSALACSGGQYQHRHSHLHFSDSISTSLEHEDSRESIVDQKEISCRPRAWYFPSCTSVTSFKEVPVDDWEHKFEPHANLDLELGPEPAGHRLRGYKVVEIRKAQGTEEVSKWRGHGHLHSLKLNLDHYCLHYSWNHCHMMAISSIPLPGWGSLPNHTFTQKLLEK